MTLVVVTTFPIILENDGISSLKKGSKLDVDEGNLGKFSASVHHSPTSICH